jgi:hypothetical protein
MKDQSIIHSEVTLTEDVDYGLADSKNFIFTTPSSIYNNTVITGDSNLGTIVFQDNSISSKISATDIELDGVSLKDTLAKINDRLSILTPDPALLKQFTALQEAYEHYKMLEALCKK